MTNALLIRKTVLWERFKFKVNEKNEIDLQIEKLRGLRKRIDSEILDLLAEHDLVCNKILLEEVEGIKALVVSQAAGFQAQLNKDSDK